jgi:hypothetical protein
MKNLGREPVSGVADFLHPLDHSATGRTASPTRRDNAFATYRWPSGALDLAKLINYNVIIITEADFSDDPAFVYPFKATKIEDFEVGVRKAIAEWRRYGGR